MSVVGMADISMSPALRYMHIVDNIDANRLLSIMKYIYPKEQYAVYSDKWENLP